MPFYSNYCSAGDEPRAMILKAINMHCTVDHLQAFKKNKHVSQIHLIKSDICKQSNLKR